MCHWKLTNKHKFSSVRLIEEYSQKVFFLKEKYSNLHGGSWDISENDPELIALNDEINILSNRIKRLCKEEKPFNWSDLSNITPTVDYVRNHFRQKDFHFSEISSCLKSVTEDAENKRFWTAVGVGVGCGVGAALLSRIVGMGASGAFGYTCAGADFAIMKDNFHYYSEKYDKIDLCTKSEGWCQYISRRLLSTTPLLMTSTIQLLVLVCLILGLAASKVKQLKRLKNTQKLIKAELKHLPADAAYRFRKELDRINDLPDAQKIKSFEKLSYDLKEYRKFK